jgi:peptide/nickel transport system permease protein
VSGGRESGPGAGPAARVSQFFRASLPDFRYVGRRVALAVPTLLLLSALVFFMGLMAPSDPITILLGQHANDADRQRLRHEYGLDRPPLVQYGDYLWHALHGDFGRSFTTRQPVTEMLADLYPATLTLAGYAMLYAVALGVPLGFLAAARQNRREDRMAVLLSLLGLSVPSFVVGPLLILIFAVWLRWLPVASTGRAVDFLLPAVALGSRPAALIARMTRAGMVESLRQDYVRTAVAKGVSGARVLVRHALRNALIPIITVIGTSTGYLMGGSFVVETIFGIRGIGGVSIESIKNYDYPLIQAVTLLGAVAFVTVNLLVDILYGFIDPRIRTTAPTA